MVEWPQNYRITMSHVISLLNTVDHQSWNLVAFSYTIADARPFLSHTSCWWFSNTSQPIPEDLKWKTYNVLLQSPRFIYATPWLWWHPTSVGSRCAYSSCLMYTMCNGREEETVIDRNILARLSSSFDAPLELVNVRCPSRMNNWINTFRFYAEPCTIWDNRFLFLYSAFVSSIFFLFGGGP